MGKRKNKNKNNNGYNGTSLAVSNKDELTVIKGNDTKTEKKEEKKGSEDVFNYTSKKSNYNYSYYKKNYDYKGEKNKTKYPEFVELCKPIQSELKVILIDKLIASGYTEVISDDGYIYAKGSVPVLLTAHMDTVHKVPVINFYEYFDEEKQRHIISSPQGIGGDDRCGIYMILEIIKTHKCSVLFCEDEESGGIGSGKFCKTEFINELSDLKYLIELDRANENDAVFYDCDNNDFTKFIEDNTGYKEATGSFSDISNLSPACKVASVNFSCGYYNAHTTSEYVIVEEMLNTIETVKKLLDVECEQFEYIEKIWNYRYNYGYYSRRYAGYYDYDDDFDYGYYKGNRNNSNTSYHYQEKEEEKSLYIYIFKEVDQEIFTYVSNGKSKDEAFGRFFLDNPEYCFADVFDYEWYDKKVCDSGWYTNF